MRSLKRPPASLARLSSGLSLPISCRSIPSKTAASCRRGFASLPTHCALVPSCPRPVDPCPLVPSDRACADRCRCGSSQNMMRSVRGYGVRVARRSLAETAFESWKNGSTGQRGERPRDQTAEAGGSLFSNGEGRRARRLNLPSRNKPRPADRSLTSPMPHDALCRSTENKTSETKAQPGTMRSVMWRPSSKVVPNKST
jgi:hypothetical protein